jgi:hypothetical protein
VSDDPEGVLFYGYSWPVDDDGADVDFDDDLDKVVRGVLRERGLPERPPSFPGDRTDRTAWNAWTELNRPGIDAWNASVAAVKAEIGVAWGNQGSWEYRAPYLYVLGSRKTAEWGNAQPVRPADLEVDDRWRRLLDVFLAHQNIARPKVRTSPAGGSPRSTAEPMTITNPKEN